LLTIFYGSCTARVQPYEWGVEQRRIGLKTGIVEKAYGPGLYFVGIGATMRTFPREIHVLEASNDREESKAPAHSRDRASRAATWRRAWTRTSTSATRSSARPRTASSRRSTSRRPTATR